MMRKINPRNGMRTRWKCDKVIEKLSIIGRASAAGVPRESATWTRPRMSTEICTTMHYWSQ
jgi:hypothetical protein